VDGPESYFEQHKYKTKISTNSMSQASDLDYDEFNKLIKLSDLLYYNEKQNLALSYKSMFTQWFLELQNEFSLNFYGIGSKRKILLQFVNQYLIYHIDFPVLVINGYNPSVSFKEIVLSVTSTIINSNKKLFKAQKFPKSIDELIASFIICLKNLHESQRYPKLLLLIHNLDGNSIKSNKFQSFFSTLVSTKQVWLVSSISNINANLLWDCNQTLDFNFLWHNLSTFENSTVETSFSDILALGQAEKQTGSKGAKYVLSSLTSNSRSLYRVLVSNQLQIMEDELLESNKQTDRNEFLGTIKHGISFKTLYNLCSEEFIASNEINFRTMLREFIEHKMANISKDSYGTEIVFVPLNLKELENLLAEELLV
ncbi:origin recognition complex subunit 2, partial [Ascoidea rubescens DSM 1968]